MKSTRGILFIAVPHKGSPVASEYTYDVLLPSDDLRYLRVGNKENLRLHTDFQTQIAEKIPLIVTVLECRQSLIPYFRTQRIMVPYDSAVLGRGSVYHIDENHHNTCKPRDKQSEFYAVVKNFVNDALYTNRQSTKLMKCRVSSQ